MRHPAFDFRVDHGALSNRIESEVQHAVLAICEDSLTGFHALFKPPLRKTGRHVRTSILPYSHGSAATCNEPQRVLSRDRDGQFRISEGVPFGNIFGPASPESSKKAFSERRLSLDCALCAWML